MPSVFFNNKGKDHMIKIWRLKVRIRNDKPRYTIGIEEDNHELIIWKYWVSFAPEYSFFHNGTLKENYSFMESLLRIGNYYTLQKKEDKTRLYSANILGISLSLLAFITQFERHCIVTQLKALSDLGYISFTEPTRGRSSEMNILLNEYTLDNRKVFHIEKDWLYENLTIDKVIVISESEDGKTYELTSPPNGLDISEMVYNLPKSKGKELEGKVPIKIGVGKELEGKVPIKVEVNKKELEGKVPINTINTIDDTVVDESAVDIEPLVASQFEGATKEFVTQLGELWGNKGEDIKLKDKGLSLQALSSGPVCLRIQGIPMDSKQKELTEQRKSGVDMSSFSTWTQVVAVFYEKETKLTLTDSDIVYINELLKISGPNQIISAIKSAKVWRATLPSTFSTLTEPEKKRCIAESQPGHFLRKMGMKHVYNFVKNSPRFRKGRSKMKSTGVVSGLDEDRMKEQQRKLIEELRRKKYGTKEKPGRTDGK